MCNGSTYEKLSFSGNNPGGQGKLCMCVVGRCPAFYSLRHKCYDSAICNSRFQGPSRGYQSSQLNGDKSMEKRIRKVLMGRLRSGLQIFSSHCIGRS